MKYEHIVRALTSEPWAIQEDKLAAICEFINVKLSGVDIPFEAVTPPQGQRIQQIGLLPLFGVLAHRANLVTNMSGGTSLQKFSRDLTVLVQDSEVDAIIMDIDSPGGSVAGVEETGAVIAAATKRKPIVAHANANAASAAYWLGSQASEFWITPSGQVGSIGVLAVHHDISKARETAGVKTTFVTAGKFKAEGSSETPLSEEARDFMQTRVDQYYDAFVKAVAKGRGVSEKTVRGDFGEGRVVGAKDALAMGMVDGIGTMEQVIERVSKGQVSNRSAARAQTIAETEKQAEMFWKKEAYAE